jgi:hypothetical protein
MKIIDEWVKGIDDQDHQAKLKHVLYWVKENYPTLEPVVKWNQPMFADHGTFIVGFSASKNHFSVGLEEQVTNHLKEEMEERGTDFTKMTVRMKWNDEVDYELLEKIIEFQIEDKKECDTFWRK